jgi:RNA recognition motif-containing protein
MQSNKLYVGNINYSTTEEELKELFANHGEVVSVKIIENRGFGFVEMSSQAEAEKAKQSLNNTEFQGRNLRVNEARARKATRHQRDQRRY